MKRNREEDVPTHLTCPITMELFEDPVVASDGHIYERKAITTHLESSKVSPMTREKLTNTNYLPTNRHLLDAVIFYKENVQNNGTESSKKQRTDHTDSVFNYDYIEKEKEKEKRYFSEIWVQQKQILFELNCSSDEYELNVCIQSDFFIDVSQFEKTYRYKKKNLYKMNTKDISKVKEATRLLKNALEKKVDKQKLEVLYPEFSDIIESSANSQIAIFNIGLVKTTTVAVVYHFRIHVSFVKVFQLRLFYVVTI